ncbi:MAG TPA: mobile mystery protein B [Coleofasciculaceae cyanobacterium]|jgi:Fic-DOC domain mobile mystery protein B
MEELFAADDAATPLTEEEQEGLIPTWIALRSELNAAEQENILAAEQWAFSRNHREILTERFIRNLHKRMFGDVWRWAGQFRKTARNIGVSSWQIASELRTLIENTQYWIEHQTYSPDEIAARFHHKLVWIHPFPNGNGRLARMMTDILLKHMGQPRFTWGQGSPVEASEIRKAYVLALRAADDGDTRSLLKFVRT